MSPHPQPKKPHLPVFLITNHSDVSPLVHQSHRCETCPLLSVHFGAHRDLLDFENTQKVYLIDKSPIQRGDGEGKQTHTSCTEHKRKDTTSGFTFLYEPNSLFQYKSPIASEWFPSMPSVQWIQCFLGSTLLRSWPSVSGGSVFHRLIMPWEKAYALFSPCARQCSQYFLLFVPPLAKAF